MNPHTTFLVVFSFFLISTLACSWKEEVSLDRAWHHLRTLDTIAQNNGGNRAAGNSGYDASLDYIVSTLQAHTDFDISIQSFSFKTHNIVGTPVLKEVSPNALSFSYGDDFRVFPASPSTSLTAPVTTVPNLGCTKEDYSGFPTGHVALVSRGSCTFAIKSEVAAAAGAAGIMIFNSPEGPAFSGAMDHSDIPALSLSHGAGLSFFGRKDVLVNISLETLARVVKTSNVIAETKEGNPDHVIISGSHLDSVPEGPGINDNGSGSATNLELALATYACRKSIVSKVRFAWWAAEEEGLLGSYHYVDELKKNEKELAKIALNLNFDMTASPNYQLGIYNGSSGPEPVREKSSALQQLFEELFNKQKIPYVLAPFTGRSDYGPFIEVGIPAAGLATGAEVIKDAAERKIFGGLANTPYDPCYHLSCDSLENVSGEALKINLEISSEMLGLLATDELLDMFHELQTPARAARAGRGKQFLYAQHPDAKSRY